MLHFSHYILQVIIVLVIFKHYNFFMEVKKCELKYLLNLAFNLHFSSCDLRISLLNS